MDSGPLPYYFYIYLADSSITCERIILKSNYDSQSSTIPWIEKLLQTIIDDYRKNTVNLILAPYLINVRKVSYDAALNIINSWLSKCGELRQLEQNFDYTVRYALKYCTKNGNRPLKLDTLKIKNLMLYGLLKS